MRFASQIAPPRLGLRREQENGLSAKRLVLPAFEFDVSGHVGCFSFQGRAGCIMGHSAGGFAAFCAVSAVVSLAVHLRTRKFLVACLLSAIISSFLFQVLEVLMSGYLDPFFAIALVNSTFLALGISVVVGRVLVMIRRGKSKDSAHR